MQDIYIEGGREEKSAYSGIFLLPLEIFLLQIPNNVFLNEQLQLAMGSNEVSLEVQAVCN